MAESHPVAPELLEYVTDHVDENDINDALREHELDANSHLIVFYRELFAQLFANVIGERLEAIGPRGAQRARELYAVCSSEWSPQLKALMRRFQHFCKLYPDLLGEGYGDGNDAISQLHFTFLPGLLLELEHWAASERQTELQAATTAAASRYESFLDSFDPVGV